MWQCSARKCNKKCHKKAPNIIHLRWEISCKNCQKWGFWWRKHTINPHFHIRKNRYIYTFSLFFLHNSKTLYDNNTKHSSFWSWVAKSGGEKRTKKEGQVKKEKKSWFPQVLTQQLCLVEVSQKKRHFSLVS